MCSTLLIWISWSSRIEKWFLNYHRISRGVTQGADITYSLYFGPDFPYSLFLDTFFLIPYSFLYSLLLMFIMEVSTTIISFKHTLSKFIQWKWPVLRLHTFCVRLCTFQVKSRTFCINSRTFCIKSRTFSCNHRLVCVTFHRFWHSSFFIIFHIPYFLLPLYSLSCATPLTRLCLSLLSSQ